MDGNLPNWPGASCAYSRAYRVLAHMARSGHAPPAKVGKRGNVLRPGTVTQNMRDAVDALNRGDEEQIKAFNLQHLEMA